MKSKHNLNIIRLPTIVKKKQKKNVKISQYPIFNSLFDCEEALTILRMDFLGAAHGWGGGGKKGPPSLKSVTHILQ